jgi:hypothetical protein
MTLSGMLRRMDLVKTDVSEEHWASFIRVTRICELGTMLTVTLYFIAVCAGCYLGLTLKNGVFWVVTPCGSCKNRRFGGTWRLLHQGDKNR